MQGRGLGMFNLPPGDQLQDGQIDLYRAAIAAQNQGAVAPIVPQDTATRDAVDPIRQVIDELRAGRR